MTREEFDRIEDIPTLCDSFEAELLDALAACDHTFPSGASAEVPYHRAGYKICSICRHTSKLERKRLLQGAWLVLRNWISA